MIEFFEDTKYSLLKDMEMSQKAIHFSSIAALFFAFHGFFFDGFESYPIRSEIASLLFATVAILSIVLLFLMKRIKKYPFLFACASIMLFYGSCVIIGIENQTPRFFINSTVVFLAFYIYFIVTTDLENPGPENFDLGHFDEDDGLDKFTNISGQISEGGNFWVGYAMVFGKSFLVIVAAVSFLFITVEIFSG